MSKCKGDPGYAPNWCIHYRYNRDVKPGQPDTCEVGVDYEAWRGTKFDGRPCFLDGNGQSKPNAVRCPSLRRPTTEEIAAHKVWLDNRMDLMGVVMVGIASWRAAHTWPRCARRACGSSPRSRGNGPCGRPRWSAWTVCRPPTSCCSA